MLVALDASGALGRERAEAEAQADADADADAEAEARADADAAVEMDWVSSGGPEIAASDDDHDESYADMFRRILGTAVESGGNDGEGGSTGPPTQAMDTGSEDGAALASFVDSDDDEPPAPGGAPTDRRRAASRKRRRLVLSAESDDE